MTTAAILICTTLVSNGAEGSTATLVCPTPQQAEAAELDNTFDQFTFRKINDVVEPDQPLPGAVANPQPIKPQPVKATVAAPVQAKHAPLAVAHHFAKPRHVRVAVISAHHHHYRSLHKPHAVVEVVPDKPPNLWDKLKELNPFRLAQGGN